MTSRPLFHESVYNFLKNLLGDDPTEIIPLAGDASSRLYYRIVVQEKSWVLMSWEPFEQPEKFPFLNILHHFQQHKVHVPEVIGSAPSLGQILLEDLGDLTLERKFWENQNQDLVLPYYQQALEELIKIHFHVKDQRQFPCLAFQNAFDTKKLLWEMNYGQEHLLEKLQPCPISPQTRLLLEKIFTNICETLSAEPQVVVHRDYHSRNLMLKLGKMRVIDFQDARLGPIQYDLVSLIYDSYVNLHQDLRHQLIKNYLEVAQPYLQGLFKNNFSQTHFEEIFQIQILQRCFKACGSFASFFNTRQDRRYLKYLPSTLKTIVEVAQNTPRYKEFGQILLDHGLLETNFEDLCAP